MKTVLLAFLHTGVSSQKAPITQRGEQFLVVADKRSGHAHAAGSGLPGRTSTGDTDQDIHAFSTIHRFEHFQVPLAILFVGELVIQLSVVDQDLAAAS